VLVVRLKAWELMQLEIMVITLYLAPLHRLAAALAGVTTAQMATQVVREVGVVAPIA